MTRFDGNQPAEDGDVALRQALAELGGTRPLDVPEDLVQRAARRLPQVTPRLALRHTERRDAAWSILRFSSLLAVVVLLGLSGWGAFGGWPPLSPTNTELGARMSAVLAPRVTALPSDGLILRVTLGALVGFGLLLPCALLLGRWPGRTAITGATLMLRPGLSLALGLPLSGALAALLLPAAQLAATLIGLPLAALLAALSLAPQLIGLVALARVVGARLEGRALPDVELEWPTAAVAALLALLLALVAVIAPLWGLALFGLLAAPGLGAALLSRVGTAPPVYR
jgi:hypothetical protein